MTICMFFILKKRYYVCVSYECLCICVFFFGIHLMYVFGFSFFAEVNL